MKKLLGILVLGLIFISAPSKAELYSADKLNGKSYCGHIAFDSGAKIRSHIAFYKNEDVFGKVLGNFFFNILFSE